jgi:hypothetical protein
MKNIRVVEIETERVMRTRRVMNILSVVYRIAQAIVMTDKILKNEVEMIV